jgi:hypothetical protein
MCCVRPHSREVEQFFGRGGYLFPLSQLLAQALDDRGALREAQGTDYARNRFFACSA